MMRNALKYLPWLLAAIAGFLAIQNSGQTTEYVPVPGPSQTVEVHDTVRIETAAAPRFVYRPGATQKDTVRLLFLQGKRDTINAQIGEIGQTRADIDTTFDLCLGDSASVGVRVLGCYNIESSQYDITVTAYQYTFAFSSGATWQWIERAAFLVAGLLSRFIH